MKKKNFLFPFFIVIVFLSSTILAEPVIYAQTNTDASMEEGFGAPEAPKAEEPKIENANVQPSENTSSTNSDGDVNIPLANNPSNINSGGNTQPQNVESPKSGFDDFLSDFSPWITLGLIAIVFVLSVLVGYLLIQIRRR